MRNPGGCRLFILSLLLALSLPTGKIIAQGTTGNEPNKVDERVVLSLLRETHGELRQALDLLAARLPDSPSLWKVALPIVGSLVLALGGWAFAFYQMKAQMDETQRQMKEAQKATQTGRLEQHLFDSLTWFSGGTQRRSIGIAVVKGNWDEFDALHSTWLSVLVSQAIYLLKESKSHHKSHEHANLYAIMNLILKGHTGLQESDSAELLAALAENKKNRNCASKHGLKDIDDGHYSTWECKLPRSTA